MGEEVAAQRQRRVDGASWRIFPEKKEKKKKKKKKKKKRSGLEAWHRLPLHLAQSVALPWVVVVMVSSRRRLDHTSLPGIEAVRGPLFPR